MMSARVPDGLIREIADRRCIVFLGAGATMASRRSDDEKRPPSWPKLLMLLSERVPEIAGDVEKYISESRPLDAAQLIRSCINSVTYRDILTRELEKSGLSAGRLHELVNEIDPKIVMTTNYDTVYEDYCNSGRAGEDLAYRVKHYYDEGLIDDIRSPNSLIMKLHGSVTTPVKTVLSRGDYFRARADHPGFFEAVKALILTHTVLFVGCSVDSDPHIQLFFEWASSALHQNIRHFAIVPDVQNPAVSEALSETLSVDFITYPEGEYSQVLDILEEIAEGVAEIRAIAHGV